MARRRRPAVDRFAEKVALAPSGCIEWIAGTNSTGYGTFYSGDRVTLAHRWSYEHHIGAIPAGLQIDHLCSNRACVNAEHMEPVTARTNLLRSTGVSARNAVKTHCPWGHAYAGDNLSISATTGERVCIACRRAQHRARRTPQPLKKV